MSTKVAYDDVYIFSFILFKCMYVGYLVLFLHMSPFTANPNPVTQSFLYDFLHIAY